MSQTAFHYPHRVRLHEVDGAGILFYAQLFTIVHNSYEEMLLNSGLSLQQILQQGEYSIPLVHAAADYHHPIQLEQLLTLTLQSQGIGSSSFTLHCEVHTAASEGSPSSVPRLRPPM